MRQSEITKVVERDRVRGRAWKFALLFVLASAGPVVLSINEALELNLPTLAVGAIAAVSAAFGVPATLSAGNKAAASSRAVSNAAGRQRLLTKAALTISQQTGIPITRIGVTLWVVYRKRRSLKEIVTRKEAAPYLWRQERFRIDVPSAHDGDWGVGRGVIGECMRTNEATYRDFRADAERFRDKSRPSREDWKAIREKGTDFGFTQDEYVPMVTRYEQIHAQPITDDGKFIGCISVDVSARHDSEAGGVDPHVNKSDVQANLVNMAEMLESAVAQLSVRP